MAIRSTITACFLLALLFGSGLSSAGDVADAVMRGDTSLLRGLLEQQADVNEPQADGATALHWAAYRDELDVVNLLIEAGADASTQNRMGATPLFLASESGDATIVQALLAAGADANETFRNGETALMMAARTGNVAVIETLLEHGAEINASEKLRGTTALMWAVAYRNTAAAQALVEHGADIGARSSAIVRGRRPYLAPSARARIESFERREGQAGSTIPIDLDGDDDTGFTFEALQDASDLGENPEQIVTVSADPTPSAQGPRPDEDETTSGAGNNNSSLFGRQSTELEWGGLTALIFAAREGDLASVRVLVEAGADVNQASEYGWTPLLTATQNRYYQLGKFLLDNGADPNISNKGNWSPLYIATDNRNIEGGDYPTRKPDMDHLDFIKLLFEHGADANVRMNSSTETRTIFTHQWLYEEGATAFLRAAQSGDIELMNLLLEHDADPNLATYENVTPLMVAAGIGWVEGVTYEWSTEQTLEAMQLLLALGADANARDTLDGRTALMGAAHKGHNAGVRLLIDNGADMAVNDIGSRDSIHKLAGVTWQAIDYADGLVRVGVQSAIPHPETSALLRELMMAQGLAVPLEGRTLDSICVVDICR